MSNDTQIVAHMALVDKFAETCVRPVTLENVKVAEKARAAVEASARQLAEQGAPGFLMPEVATPQMLDALRTGSRKDYPSDELCRVRYAALIAARPLTAAPIPEASGDDEREALNVITKCCAALAEELSAWDIDPPLHHVAEAHDLCERWLAARAQKGKP